MGQKSYRWELSIWQELLENTFPCWKRQVLFTIITARMATSCSSEWCPGGLLGGMGRAEGIVQEEAVGSILWSSARSVKQWLALVQGWGPSDWGQLYREGSGILVKWAEQEPAVCPCCGEGQTWSGFYEQACSQPGRGGIALSSN